MTESRLLSDRDRWRHGIVLWLVRCVSWGWCGVTGVGTQYSILSSLSLQPALSSDTVGPGLLPSQVPLQSPLQLDVCPLLSALSPLAPISPRLICLVLHEAVVHCAPIGSQ